MKYVYGVIVALAIATATQVVGAYVFGTDLRFLAGWWSCLGYMLITRERN